MLPDMAQFVDDYQINGLRWTTHEKTGEAQTVFTAAASISLSGGGNFQAGRHYTHDIAPIGHTLWEDLRSLFSQCSNVFDGFRCVFCGSFLLHLQMADDPRFMLLYESINLRHGQPHRSTNQDPAIFCNFQRQRFAAGTNQLIVFHTLQDNANGRKVQVEEQKKVVRRIFEAEKALVVRGIVWYNNTLRK